jgi:hypothetical protein
LLQGLSVCGHSELIESNNQGNFLQVLRWYAETKNKVKQAILENSPNFFLKNDLSMNSKGYY